MALTWPMVPHDVIQLVAGWGVLTGILEIVAAAALPCERVASWLLGAVIMLAARSFRREYLMHPIVRALQLAA